MLSLTRMQFFDAQMKILILLIFACSFAMVKLGPIEALDSMFYYSFSDAQSLFSGLDGPHRLNYLYTEYFDLGFILLYTWTAVRAYRKAGAPIVIAFLPAVFDYIETLCEIMALRVAGDVPEWLGYITCAKWSSAILLLAVLGFTASKKAYNARANA